MEWAGRLFFRLRGREYNANPLECSNEQGVLVFSADKLQTKCLIKVPSVTCTFVLLIFCTFVLLCFLTHSSQWLPSTRWWLTLSARTRTATDKSWSIRTRRCKKIIWIIRIGVICWSGMGETLTVCWRIIWETAGKRFDFCLFKKIILYHPCI